MRLEGSEAETDEEYCLVSIEVSNVYREDVLVRFALNTGGLIPLQLYRVLRAGTTTRIVLPHPRIELDATGQPATGQREVVDCRRYLRSGQVRGHDNSSCQSCS